MTNNPAPPLVFVPSDPRFKYEVRLYGLNKHVKIEHVTSLLSELATIVYAVINEHPSGLNWAQVWVDSEEGLHALLHPHFQQTLGETQVRIVRGPHPSTYFTPSPSPTFPPVPKLFLPRPPAHVMSGMLAGNRNGYGSLHDTPLHLRRNLYVLNLALDLAEFELALMFTPFGDLIHVQILTDLDKRGRRRGFIMFQTHEESRNALRSMHGRWHQDMRLDVTWSHREIDLNKINTLSSLAHYNPRPPSSLPLTNAVIVENIDPKIFADLAVIRQMFRHFGEITWVAITHTPTYSILIYYRDIIAAIALAESSGKTMIGGNPIVTRRVDSQPPRNTFNHSDQQHHHRQQQNTSDPFKADYQPTYAPRQPPSSFNMALQAQAQAQAPQSYLHASGMPFRPFPQQIRETSSSEDTNELLTNDRHSHSRSGESHSTLFSSTDNHKIANIATINPSSHKSQPISKYANFNPARAQAQPQLLHHPLPASLPMQASQPQMESHIRPTQIPTKKPAPVPMYTARDSTARWHNPTVWCGST